MQRIRILSALGDYQLALSAADFLYEAEEDEKYTLEELRRFRCYENTAIVSYARPFSQSKGKTPKLSLEMCRETLNEEEMQLHNKVIELRKKFVAHADLEMMNFASYVRKVSSVADGYYSILTQHDEGLKFHRFKDQWDLVNLISKVHFSLYETTHDTTQSDPNAFDVTVHSPNNEKRA